MQRMKVVLPEPDGPMMQTVSPFVTLERDALQHLEPAEALVDVGRLHDYFAPVPVAGSRVPRPRSGSRRVRSRSRKLSSSPCSLFARRRSIHAWMNVQTVVSMRYQNATAMKYSFLNDAE